MDSSAFSSLSVGLDRLITTVVITLAVCIPLGIWKIVDIIIWLVKHVSIGIK